MPVLTTPSTSSRFSSSTYSSASSYTPSYSSYSRGSSYSSSRTSSLDRSPYSSYTPSYTKYLSTTSTTKDYSSSSRPPSGYSWRSSSVTPSYHSSSASTRASPARSSTLSRRTSTEEGSRSQSETRETNNNYTNGTTSTIKRTRDYSSVTTSSYLSKSRIASKLPDWPDSNRTETPRVSERIRSLESSGTTKDGATPFRSRFLRSSQDSSESSSTSRRATPTSDLRNGTEIRKTYASTDSKVDISDSPRPSVGEIRRRYDVNHNECTSANRKDAEKRRDSSASGSETRRDSLTKPISTLRSRSGSDSEESDRDLNRNRSPRVSIPSLLVQSSPTPERESTVNGSVDPEPQDKVVKKLTARDALRSSSPSALSSSSEGDPQDGSTNTISPTAARRAAARANNKLANRGSRNSISDSGSESPSPKLAYRVKRETQSAVPKEGLVGLKNIGNTCFMNSVLQCLSNTRHLLEYVITEEYAGNINTTTSSMKGALIKAFSSVLVELWKPSEEDDSYLGGAVNPTALKSQIQKFAPRFMGYSQQDAQEFLRYLLEGLHEDVNRVTVKIKPAEQDIPDGLSDNQKAIESWKRYLRRDDSKIVDLFVGQLKSTLQCTVCGHCSVTCDPFWDLSLPIPASGKSSQSSVKLQHCLDLFSKEEVLDGDEKPTCAKCQTRRKCTKTFSIQKFPQILVLHLKRFSPGERFRKLDASVDFPLNDLDLSPYAASGIKPTACSYQLYGVINHTGSAYSGHYTAYCLHPYKSGWNEYNDSRVSSISSQRVVSSDAYLLFYELESHEAHL